ncbi:putative nuclear transport factor 2 [Orchesella cincta]|uniref:NTF2-related export protein n=1 Tax=Orchesella cincta TaxID=48709 RepID=A0A1D2MTZ5_ORCCI|nr:putative nuclear transport factor 2 [Orchesella cincta]
MANLNPQYDTIGKAFAQQYYGLFDNPAQRPNLHNLYSETESLMSFEGQQCQGAAKIMEKFNSLSFQKILHIITSVDCQPMFDGGILINVIGQLKTDDDPPHTYSQTFVLKPLGGTYFCQHDIFRLGIHNTL